MATASLKSAISRVAAPNRRTSGPPGDFAESEPRSNSRHSHRRLPGRPASPQQCPLPPRRRGSGPRRSTRPRRHPRKPGRVATRLRARPQTTRATRSARARVPAAREDLTCSPSIRGTSHRQAAGPAQAAVFGDPAGGVPGETASAQRSPRQSPCRSPRESQPRRRQRALGPRSRAPPHPLSRSPRRRLGEVAAISEERLIESTIGQKTEQRKDGLLEEPLGEGDEDPAVSLDRDRLRGDQPARPSSRPIRPSRRSGPERHWHVDAP